MIAGLMVVAVALSILPRPNASAVRLNAIVAARGPLGATRVPAWGDRWPERFTRLWFLASRRPRRLATGAGGVVMVSLFMTGVLLPVSMAAGLVSAVVVDGGVGVAGGRRARRDDAALTQALFVLEAELVAGAREDAALIAAAAVSGRHARLLREAAASTGYGGETADVLARSASLRTLSAAWRVRYACGAPLAEVVAQVARDVDLRRKRQAAVNGALAGPRSSSVLLATLPLVGTGLGTAMGARPLRFLFASSGGSVVLLAGVGLDVAGLWWTATMVRRAGR